MSTARRHLPCQSMMLKQPDSLMYAECCYFQLSTHQRYCHHKLHAAGQPQPNMSTSRHHQPPGQYLESKALLIRPAVNTTCPAYTPDLHYSYLQSTYWQTTFKICPHTCMAVHHVQHNCLVVTHQSSVSCHSAARAQLCQ